LLHLCFFDGELSIFPAYTSGKKSEERCKGSRMDNDTKAASGLPTAEQLWSVMDFAHRFPDLTRVLTEAPRADINQEDLDKLVFPSLAAPDPREIRARTKKKKKMRQQVPPEKEKDIFGSSIPPPEAPPKKKKRPFLSYLLNFFTVALVFFLIWSYDLHSIYQQSKDSTTRSQVPARQVNAAIPPH
jgi:hypothetical protein